MKTIFFDVDTLYDFMRNDESFKGALPVEGAKEIESNLGNITQLAREMGIQIIYPNDWHTKDSKEFSDNPDYIDSFPPHCLQYTKGAMHIPATIPVDPYIVDWQDKLLDERELEKHGGDIVIYKDAFDVFKGNKHTDRVLEIIKPDRAIVYGVATNKCVDYAVMGLRKRNIDVYAVTDAMKELPGADLEKIMEKWKANKAKLIETADLYRESFWLK